MKALEPRDDGSEGGRFPRRATSANPEETSSEPIPVFSPNRLRFSVVATITGNLLASAIGVRTAATGLHVLTLLRTLAISASTLHTSLLSMDSPRASASQFVESKRGENLTRADSGILSEPFAFPYSGHYNWNSTGLNNRSSRGGYWSSRTYSTASSHSQAFTSTSIRPQLGDYKGYGFAVRCTPLRRITAKRHEELLNDTTNCKSITLMTTSFRIKDRRIKILVARGHSRICMQ